MPWNSKGKINLAAAESAKPQKSMTLARNVQRSQSSSSAYFLLFAIPSVFPYTFCLCVWKLSIFFSSSVVPYIPPTALPTSFTSTCHVPNQPHTQFFCVPLFFCMALLLNLEGWFSTWKGVFFFFTDQTDANFSHKLSYSKVRLHHIDDDRQMARAMNLNRVRVEMPSSKMQWNL